MKASPPPTPPVDWQGTPFAGGNLQRVLVALRIYPHFFSDTPYHTVRSAIIDKLGFVGIVELFHSIITSPDVFLDIFSLDHVRSKTALASPRVTDTAPLCLPMVYGDPGLECRLLEGKNAEWMYIGSASSPQAQAYASGIAVVGGAKRVGQHEDLEWRGANPSKHYRLMYAKPGEHYSPSAGYGSTRSPSRPSPRAPTPA